MQFKPLEFFIKRLRIFEIRETVKMMKILHLDVNSIGY